jgi:DNA repair exonuclease SbcCD ATPase subunit
MFAAVHRSFASRDGELYDYATGRDSFIEEEIAIDGCGVFRARVNIDGPKRNSDAVLTAIRPDGAFTLNDGRVSDFDRAVALHFPSKDLLLASAFAAQNKTGSFITLDKKARKALFMRLLAIERYQTMSDTARQAASLVDQGRGRLMAVRDELARGTTSDLVDELDRLANRLQQEGGDAETQRIDIGVTIAGLEYRLALVQDQVAAHAAATQRVRTLDADVAGRRAELARLQQERAQAIADAAAARARLLTQRTAKIDEIDTLIANNQRLIANRAGVARPVRPLTKRRRCSSTCACRSGGGARGGRQSTATRRRRTVAFARVTAVDRDGCRKRDTETLKKCRAAASAAPRVGSC